MCGLREKKFQQFLSSQCFTLQLK